MLIKTLALLFGAAGVALSAGSPSKPEMNPGLPRSRLEDGLRNHLNPTKSNWDYWGRGWIPKACRDIATSHSLNPADFTVFNVHYSDCNMAWVFCRHKNSGASELDMIDMFGRAPVRMRSFVRHFIATPGLNDGAAAFTFSNGDVVFEDKPQMSILMHEISHSLDWHASPGYSSPFSGNAVWQDNYNQDSATPTGYGRTSWMEDYAETGMIGVFDKVVPGGIGSIAPNWNSVFHQYATFQGYLGNLILPGGTCGQRFQNSETVQMGGSARFRMAEQPHTGFPADGNITMIVPKKEVEGLVAYCSGH